LSQCELSEHKGLLCLLGSHRFLGPDHFGASTDKTGVTSHTTHCAQTIYIHHAHSHTHLTPTPLLCFFEQSVPVLTTPPYSRCCRSVSVVPPAYDAQLAADRGQILAQGRELLGEHGAAAAAAATSGSTSSSSGEGAGAVRGEESVGGAAAPGFNGCVYVRPAGRQRVAYTYGMCRGTVATAWPCCCVG